MSVVKTFSGPATVFSQPCLSPPTQKMLARKIAGADIIRPKDYTTLALGVVITILIDVILINRNRVTSVSTFLQDEYGHSNVSIGVPVILGNNGVEKILEPDLSSTARKEFDASVSIIKDRIS